MATRGSEHLAKKEWKEGDGQRLRGAKVSETKQRGRGRTKERVKKREEALSTYQRLAEQRCTGR